MAKNVPKAKRLLILLSLVWRNPSYGLDRILAELPERDGKKIFSRSGIHKALTKLGLNTAKKRRAWARRIASAEAAEAFAEIAARKIRRKLTPEERLEMLRLVEREELPVSRATQAYGVSRKNFYKWKKRYEASVPGKEYQAVCDQRPVIERRWNQLTNKQVEAILKIVREHPEYSTHKVTQILAEVGNHGVQNAFQRLNLNTYEKRLAYAETYRPIITPVTRVLDRLKPIFGKIPVISAIPPPAREKIASSFRPFVASFLTLIVFSTTFIYWLKMVSQAPTSEAKLGLFFATIALSVGSIFFAYSMKYYLTLAIVLSFSRQPLEEGGGYAVGLNGRLNNNQKNGNGRNWWQRIFGLNGGNGGIGGIGRNGRNGMVAAGGLQPSLEHIKLKRYPFISIHLPFYNEKKVAERILKACTAMDYPNYEIVICDDSTDETIEIVNKFAKEWNKGGRPRIKVLHRSTRQGFKGGALAYALKHIDPKAEFVVVFDADFIPYPDTLELFVKYFKANNNNNSEDYTKNNIACIAGYQWHVLNKSENWITRGVRTEYAGSYVIERPGQEILGAIKLIHGSVYAIRADVLKKFDWGTSITEDFELTLKLYEQGYKVIYTPYIQGPAECVSTLKRLIRQRMRWSEGHSHCIKKMFLRLIKSPKLNPMEKLEVLYLSPYYLQAFFFLVGTFSWLMAETVFRARLPFWTSLWGWSLVLTNFFSLPLVNAVGLFLEESEEKDYLGLLSFIALSYILVPFQAYASVKGFLEKEEGPWFRTPKTGKITDIFTRGKFYRWLTGIIPGRAKPSLAPIAQMSADKSRLALNPYLALATANNQFSNFKIRRRSFRWLGNLVFTLFIFLTSALIVFAPLLPLATVSANETGRVITGNGKEILKEKINSQMMASWRGGEAIFHQEPRIRYKFESYEIELTTLKAGGLGETKKGESYREGPLFVYPEIFKDSDLIYRVRESRINESLLLKKYQPIEYLEQRLRLIDLAVVKDDKGQIHFASKNGGAELFTFPKPYMYEEKNPSQRSEALVYGLEKKGNDYILRKVLTEEGKKWLADPARQFPVVIDPTIYISDVSTGIAATSATVSEAGFGSNQRKIAYMPNATGGAAWYAFHADGQIIRYKKCFASSFCDAAGDWSVNVAVDVNGDAGDGNPNIFVQGDTIWIFWIDNATAGTATCCTAIDSIQWRALNTTNDSFNQECSSDDQGSLDYTNFAYGAAGTNGDVVGGYSDTAGDAEADIFEVPSGTDCSAAPLNTDVTYTIETGSGLPTGTTTMRPVALGLGNKIHVVYDDAANEIRHSIRDVSTNTWDSADTVADNGNVVDDIFSVTTDGSSLWLLYRDTTTTTVLQKCASPCTTTWTNLTAPWTSGLISADYPNIGYMSTENDLKACINNGSATTSQDVVCKSTDATTVSWGDQFAIGFTASDFAELSLVMSAGNADQMALVVHDVTNTTLKFATVPEKTIVFLLLTPILPLALTKIRKGLKKRAQKRSQPVASVEKRTLMSVLLVACVLLMFLPFLVTFNELLTQLIIKTQFYQFLQKTVIPWEIRLVGVLMMPLGFRPAVVGEYLGLGLTGATPRPFLLEIAWNCIGLQSLVFFIVTALVGLQGDKYTNGSKVKALMIGLLGTFLVNLGRITVVVLLAYYLGQNTAMMFHEYGSNLATLTWLFFFWWFAYAFVLEVKTATQEVEEEDWSGVMVAPALVGAGTPGVGNPYLALKTANSQFNNFSIKPKRLRWVSKTALAILLAISVSLFSLTRGVPEVLATNPNATQYLSNDASGVLTGVTSAWKLLNTVDSPQGSTSIEIDRNEAVDAQLQIEPGQTNTATGTKCSTTPNGRGWILDTVFDSGGSIAAGTWSFFIYESDTGPNRDGHIDVCVYRTTVSGGIIGTANLLFQSQGDSSWSTTDTMNNATNSISQTTSSQSSFTIGPNEYLYVEYWYHNVTKVNEGTVTMTFYTGESGATDPYITTPGITIPENVALFFAAAPFIPMIVSWMKKKKQAIELLSN